MELISSRLKMTTNDVKMTEKRCLFWNGSYNGHKFSTWNVTLTSTHAVDSKSFLFLSKYRVRNYLQIVYKQINSDKIN